VSPNEELIRIIKEFKIRCDAGTDPKDLSIVMNMLPDSLKRGKALTEKKPEELCGHSGPGNSCSATDAFDSNNKCVFEDKTKCSERAKTIGGRRWVNGDIAAALREIERLEKIEAQVQTCKRSGHRYYAASHEYPCPRCEIESLTREAEDRGLEAADAKATLKSADNKIAELNLALEKKTAIAQEYWDKFRNYEDEYILPTFKWAEEMGFDLHKLVDERKGNCVVRFFQRLRGDLKKTKRIIEDLHSLTKAEDPVEVGCYCIDPGTGDGEIRCGWCLAGDILGL
jgi:hypothetical protein